MLAGWSGRAWQGSALGRVIDQREEFADQILSVSNQVSKSFNPKTVGAIASFCRVNRRVIRNSDHK
jgi:hypothetical protein